MLSHKARLTHQTVRHISRALTSRRSMTSTTEEQIRQALLPFSSCDCSDALLKLGVANGGYIPGPTLWSPKRQEGDTKVVGRAYTVKYALNNDPTPKVASHYIDSIPSGAVVYISAPKGIVNAVYGGLMSTRAQASGAAGTVVHGRIRDLSEHRALGYPVFAEQVGTASPYEVAKVIGTNVPLQLEGEGMMTRTVAPGDWVVADLDGVVVIPQDKVEAALPLMQPQVDADTKVAEALKGGMSFVEASKKFRAPK